jgi:UDP-N-acetylmuramate dehydrogenase
MSDTKWYSGLEHVVRENVSLAPMTSYKTGGCAEFFAEPTSEKELGAVLTRAADNYLPVKILGQGSNLLVADRGVKGLVVRLPRAGFSKVIRDKNKLLAGAGHSLPALVNYTVNRGMSGMECLVGVPGTVGAFVRSVDSRSTACRSSGIRMNASSSTATPD